MKNRKIKKILTCIVLQLILAFSFVMPSGNAFAGDGNYLDKILLNTLKDCMTSSNFTGTLYVRGDDMGLSPEFKKFDDHVIIKSAAQNSFGHKVPTDLAGKAGLSVPGYSRDEQSNGVNCKNLVDAVFKEYGKTKPSYTFATDGNASERGKFLEDFGYKRESISDKKGCFVVTYSRTVTENVESTWKKAVKENGTIAEFCAQRDLIENHPNKMVGGDFTYGAFDDVFVPTVGREQIKLRSGTFTVPVRNVVLQSDGDLSSNDGLLWDFYKGNYCGIEYDGKNYKACNEGISVEVKNYGKYTGGMLYDTLGYSANEGKSRIEYLILIRYEVKDNSGSNNGPAKFTRLADQYPKVREFFSGSSEMKEITLAEKKDLYQWYLKNVYSASTNTTGGMCQDEKPDNIIGPNGELYVYTGCQWCELMAGHPDRYVTVFSDSQNYKLDLVADRETFIRLAAGLFDEEDAENGECGFDFYDRRDDPDTPVVGGGDDDLNGDGDSEASDLQRCMKMSNSLGWILCPVIQWLNDGVQGIYSRVESDFLIVQSSFFENEKVKEIWGSMLGFADTFLVVVIVAIVFSQLTGVGIDNYGIKRILPKVIVVAILVNMSYLVCQIAVEVSNIVGKSLNDMLSVGISVAPGEMADSKGSLLFGTLLTAISGGLIGGVAASFVTGGWFAVLIPLLVALVTALVAVFFFFIMLGIRKAAIIILVLVSPLAMVCYALPNTKNIFDRWLKYFKSLLLLFPICGAMMGGGQLMAKLLMSVSTDYFMAFTGLMLMVVPFFFIPKFLRGALDAVGGIGAAVTGMSRRIGGGASRAAGRLEKSDYVQDSMNRHAGERARRIAENYRQRRQNGEILSAREGRRYARYNKQANEWELSNSAAHIGSIIDAQNKSMADQRVKDEEASINSNLNVNDASVLGREYANSLNALMDNPDNADALARTKALQNIMSGTENGRNAMSDVLKAAARNNAGDPGRRRGLQAAASHLATEHGGTLKGANRGTFNMANQMASGEWGKVSSALPAGSNADSYSYAGSEKYTAESFAKADDAAIKGMAKEYDRIWSQVLNSDYTPTASERAFMNNMENIVYDINNSSNVKLSSNVKGFIKNIPAVKH